MTRKRSGFRSPRCRCVHGRAQPAAFSLTLFVAHPLQSRARECQVGHTPVAFFGGPAVLDSHISRADREDVVAVYLYSADMCAAALYGVRCVHPTAWAHPLSCLLCSDLGVHMLCAPVHRRAPQGLLRDVCRGGCVCVVCFRCCVIVCMCVCDCVCVHVCVRLCESVLRLCMCGVCACACVRVCGTHV